MEHQSWKDFFKGKGLDEIEYQCLIAEKMIADFCVNYDFDGEPPKILISTSIGFGAHATQNGEIIINADTFEWLNLKNEKYPDQLTPETNKHNATLTMLLSIVAHEFIHIARGHYEVLKINKNYRDVLEYDADQFGTAALFRFLYNYLHNIDGKLTPFDIKKIVLQGVFFYLREFVEDREPEYNKAHMPFHIRLWWTIEKLAWIDNYIDANTPTEKYSEETKKLHEICIGADHYFTNHRKLRESKLMKLSYNSQDIVIGNIDKIREKWNKVYPLVLDKQVISETVGVPNLKKITK